MGSYSTQYKAAVFYQTDEQKRLAIETKDEIEATQHIKVKTGILPLSRFYVAEAYHQKYGLRGHKEFLREFHSVYPTDEALMNSTAAARINGYVSGYGTAAKLQEEIDKLGLSPEAQQKLMEIAKRNAR
jgi:peptide-methionine (S)-S-oxide reductase